jgi:hypothetical protein
MKNLLLLLLLSGFWGQISAQTYTFNQKVSFRIVSPDGTASSYCYLNTRTGNVGQDAKAWAMINPELPGVMIFSYVEYGKAMTQYTQMEGRKYKTVMPLANENYTARDFWKTFKKTGKRQAFGKYTAEEYSGVVPDREVGRVSVWVSPTPAPNITGQPQGDVLGLYGVGYLYNPDKKAYFYLVHFNDNKGSTVTLTNIEGGEKSFTFNGYTETKTPPVPAGLPKEKPPTPADGPQNPAGSSEIHEYKCATAYDIAIQSIETSLPGLKEMLANNALSAGQKAELSKQIGCMEKKLPYLRQARTNALRIDSQFVGNTEKRMEACQEVSEKLDKQTAAFCEQ